MRTVAVWVAMGATAGLAVREPPWPALGSVVPAPSASSAPVHIEEQSRDRVMKAVLVTPSHAKRITPAVPVARGPSDQNWQLARDISRAFESRNAEERERALTEWLPLWTASDPVGAIDWVAGLEDGTDRRIAATGLMSQLAASDPAAAIEVAQRFDV